MTDGTIVLGSMIERLTGQLIGRLVGRTIDRAIDWTIDRTIFWVYGVTVTVWINGLGSWLHTDGGNGRRMDRWVGGWAGGCIDGWERRVYDQIDGRVGVWTDGGIG